MPYIRNAFADPVPEDLAETACVRISNSLEEMHNSLKTVPKLVNIVCIPEKWGEIAINIHRLALYFHTVVHFRLEVGGVVRHCKALPNLERSPAGFPGVCCDKIDLLILAMRLAATVF